jgi:hypothetical protein
MDMDLSFCHKASWAMAARASSHTHNPRQLKKRLTKSAHFKAWLVPWLVMAIHDYQNARKA